MSSQIYPVRSFIRFTAKSQLTADLAGDAVPIYVNRGGAVDQALAFQPADDGGGAYCEVFQAAGDCLDDDLLQHITATMFDPDRHPEIYRSYDSRTVAAQVETEAAAAIVLAYKQACLEQRQQLVAQFNHLFDR
jgi:hypothetical protein